MKHFLVGLLAIVIALAVGFWLFSRPAVSPSPEAQVLTPTPIGNITVTTPRPNDTVGRSIPVEGMARTFEQNVQWRLTDTAGVGLARGFTTAEAVDVGAFGPYAFVIAVPEDAPADLVIHVFEISAENGSEINKISVPVLLQP